MTYNPETKKKALKMFEQGVPPLDICDNLGMAKTTLYSWIRAREEILAKKTEEEINEEVTSELEKELSIAQKCLQTAKRLSTTPFEFVKVADGFTKLALARGRITGHTIDKSEVEVKGDSFKDLMQDLFHQKRYDRREE